GHDASGEAAVAGGAEGGCNPGGRGRDHGERWVAERAVGQRREGDGLAGANDGKGVRDAGRRLVVGVAALGRGHEAGTSAGDAQEVTDERAGASDGEGQGQAGGRRGREREGRIAEGPVR